MCEEVVRLEIKVRRCHNKACARFRKPYRPESEGGWALPGHEFGLEVIAMVGNIRYREKRTRDEIHTRLVERGIEISARSVSNLIDRYDELVATAMGAEERIQQVLGEKTEVVLGIDGLQPEVGHEVLWVIRECGSGEILLAKPLLSSTGEDIGKLLQQVQAALPCPVAAVVSDGQRSIRKAVAESFPNVPHGLCHYHYLKEAVKPAADADRHAKKLLKKTVRGIRPLERRAAQRTDAWAAIIDDYCQAVRSALTDDGRPPLDAAGLRLHQRLQLIAASLQRVAKKRNFLMNYSAC